jgi:hypothetical protein
MEETNDQVEQQTTEQVETDNTDWKAKAIEFETKYKSENGLRRRLEKDLKQSSTKTGESETQTQATQQKGFDYAQKAYLKSSGINADEFDFVKEVMDATGKSDIDAVLDSKYFKAELKERRETKATAEAMPGKTNRAGNQTRNDVDYWIAQGKLPPADQPELRRKVVNAKIAAEKARNQFTTNAVVNGTRDS